MEDQILRDAARRYGISAEQVRPLSGGHFSHVYEFIRDNERRVLRIIPPNEDIDGDSLRGVLAWMDFLATNRMSVPRPIPSDEGKLVEIVERDAGSYAVVAFEEVLGTLVEKLAPEQWSAEQYGRLGSTVGRMHAIAKSYEPIHSALRRPKWDDSGNCFNPMGLLDESQAAILQRRREVLDHVETLPKSEDSYGLIHADLHFGNVIMDETSGAITIIDFDDCCYGWYAMDIAMTLFDMMVVRDPADRDAFALEFLDALLDGYRKENPMDSYWIGQLPHFLKLLEIGVYSQVYRDCDPGDSDSWVGKFMADRRSRIEGGVPYVGLDFGRIA
jgi:Ser/Thr protein kinase RdoA (MazF antagonist)